MFHGQTVLLYYNSSVWLEMRDTSSWDQNLAEPILVQPLIFWQVFSFILISDCFFFLL